MALAPIPNSSNDASLDIIFSCFWCSVWTYVKLVDELGQDEMVPLRAARSRQDIGHSLVNGRILLVPHAFQVAVESYITRQLEALVLRSEWSHALIWPHGPGACSHRNMKGLKINNILNSKRILQCRKIMINYLSQWGGNIWKSKLFVINYNDYRSWYALSSQCSVLLVWIKGVGLQIRKKKHPGLLGF